MRFLRVFKKFLKVVRAGKKWSEGVKMGVKWGKKLAPESAFIHYSCWIKPGRGYRLNSNPQYRHYTLGIIIIIII